MKLVRLLLSYADEVTFSGNHGALNVAAAAGHVVMVRLLLERDFNNDTRYCTTSFGELCGRSTSRNLYNVT